MTGPVRVCDDHGYFEGGTCPACTGEGRLVLSGDRRRQLSKFLSGALRHFPGDAGLELDEAGWTAFDDLVTAAASTYGWASRNAVVAVVTTDPKGRFERAGDGEIGATDRVRAGYGHSVNVDLGSTDAPVPDTLYHGTAPRNLERIHEEGLRPMSRQHVHLSGSVEGAREVGRRHAGDPVVLEVDAASLVVDGHDVTRRGRGVYTTDRVPPPYLTVP